MKKLQTLELRDRGRKHDKAALHRGDGFLSPLFGVMGCLLLGGCFVILAYFAFRDPDRLHSEEHLATVRQQDLVWEKGGRIPVNPVDLPALTNPYHQAAISGDRGEAAAPAGEGANG